MATKEVTFINVDTETGFFYEDSVTATVITDRMKTFEDGWYVVEGDVLRSEFIETEGDVKIILADGCNYYVGGTDILEYGSLTIYGQKEGSGSFDSDGSSILDAGIMVKGDRTLTIVGGKVKAIGATGASGIGGTFQQDVSNITIYGGDVYAEGGGDGAGIGSANGAVASYITINGGRVVAIGGSYAAGIGGGNYGSAHHITINGGYVEATGGRSAAGIGAGTNSYNNDTTALEFNGGYVKAHGTDKAGITGASGAGIGSGWASGTGTVRVNGGYVIAEDENSNQASSIGGGGSSVDTKWRYAQEVYVNGDMKLVIDGNEISHTSTDNLNREFENTTRATIESQHQTIGGLIAAGEYTPSTTGFYGNGGLYYLEKGQDASGEDNVFKDFSIDNDTAKGGVFYNEAKVDLTGAVFSDNKAIGNVGGAQGGAIFNAGTMSLVGATFKNNIATGSMGESLGGAVYNAEGATLNVDGIVTFEGNLATTDGGAVYNAGTVNLTGAIKLIGNTDNPVSYHTDTFVNAGTLNWNLATYAEFFGYELLSNVEGSKQTITIDPDAEIDNFDIACGDFSGIDSFADFILTGLDGVKDVTISVDGDAVNYGEKDTFYFLQTNTENNTDYLTLRSVKAGALMITTAADKWFKKNETISISGVASIDVATVTVSGYGSTVTVDVIDGKWSCYLAYVAETPGTTLTVQGHGSDGKAIPAASATYTLKVDTVDPTIKVTRTSDGYVKTGDDVHWYKQDAEVYFWAGVSDATSDIRIARLNGKDYNSGDTRYLDTWNETATVQVQMFTAQDNAGNAAVDGFRYGVDGTGPEISDAVFSGDTVYVESPHTVWFKQGDENAALNCVVGDDLSGLKLAALGELRYDADSKKFAIATTEELDKVTTTIMAMDNVGNRSESEIAYTYGVDGTGPEIGEGSFEGDTRYVDADGKTWFKKGDTTAALVIDITDAKSGLQSATFAGVEYADGKFMLADATPTEDFKITATDNVGNVSEKSQTSAGVVYKVGIDSRGPRIAISTEPATDLTQSVTVTITCTDRQSGVKDGSVKYAINGGDLIDYTGSFTITANDLISVVAADNVGNTSEQTKQIYNICKNGDDFVAGEEITVAAGDKYRLNSVTLSDGSSFTLGVDSEVFSKTVEMQNGTLNTVDGVMATETLLVKSGEDNKITGILDKASSVSNVAIADGAALTVSKDQFDTMMQFSDYVSLGKLFVSATEGNDLTANDITTLVGKTGVGTVEFLQDLTGIRKLTISTGKTGVIGFYNGYGTDKSDTLRFAKDSDTFFGNTGYKLDLGAGNNKVQIDDCSVLVLNPELDNVSTFKIGKNAKVEVNSAINFANGRKASFSVNKESSVILGADLKSGDKKLSFSSEKKSAVTTANIVAQAANDKISIGKESSFVAKAIDFGSGNDKISIGKSSVFEADKVVGVETISLGKYGSTTIEEIAGVKKLSIENGSKSSKAWLSAGTITGTTQSDTFDFGKYNDVNIGSIALDDGNDTLKLGSYSEIKIDSLDFGDGNDTLKLGSYSDIEIDSLDFGEGTKDKLTIGKGSTLTITNLDVDGIDSFSMSSNAELYLGTDSYNAAMDTEWGQKYSAQIFEIGKLA